MTLKDAGVRLIDCVHKTPAAQADGYPYVAIPQMKNGRIDFTDARRISRSDFVEWTKKARPQIHDVVLSRRTNPGVTATFGAEVDFALGQNLVLLRADGTRVNPDFLRWLVVSPDWWAEIEKYNNVGAVFDSLKCADVPKFCLPIPPQEVQSKISELLSAIDDKIELNRRMNETLEAMAQAIFRDWFVDFGPVRRKMAGATDPVAIMGGLTPDPTRAAELAALFPDTLGDDDLPVGWTAGDFGDLATTAGESVDPTRLGEHTPYIGLEHMPRRSISLVNWDYAGKVSSQKSRFSCGQVLFGKLRPYFHKVGIAPVDGVCSTDIVVLDSRTDFDRELIACCASSDAFVAFTDLTSSGTKMPRTSWSHMKSYELAIADAPVRRAFSELIRPMHQKVVGSVGENRTLAETRDYLLPRLMSGEVRVGDAALEIAA